MSSAHRWVRPPCRTTEQATGGDAGPTEGRPNRADLASWWTIGIVFLLLLATWSKHVPSMSDTWYHLAIAEETLERGGVPLWDDWEFAPHGRPNLYPPVLHLILATLGAVLGGVENAGRALAVTLLPAALLTTWYAGRRLLGPQAAFLAVLFCLLDVTQYIVMEAYIAACLTNVLAPLVVVAVVERKPWHGAVGMAVLYWSHIGFPHVVALGLLLFGVLERQYLRTVLKVVGIALLWWTPLLAHQLRYAEWVAGVFRGGGLPMPLLQKLFSLQIVNLLIAVPGLIGARKLWLAGGEKRIVPCMMLGFLPILASYGGRYAMHSMPFWALAAGWAAQGLLSAEAPRIRYALLALATLVPTPAMGFFGKPTPLPFTTPIAIVAQILTPDGILGDRGEKSERKLADCDELAAWLRANTAEDAVISANKEWVADMVARLADRRVDFGAWWECGTEDSKRANRAWRDEQPEMTFVAINPENDSGSILRATEPIPGVDACLDIGRFLVGQRHAHLWQEGGREVPLGSFDRIPGTVGSLTEAEGRLTWSVSSAPAKAAAIVAEAGDLGPFDGIEVRLRSDRTDPVHLALSTSDGRELGASIILPRAREWRVVRIPLAWMTLSGAPRPDALAETRGLTAERLYLMWALEKGEPKREVEVHHVRLLTEADGLHAR